MWLRHRLHARKSWTNIMVAASVYRDLNARQKRQELAVWAMAAADAPQGGMCLRGLYRTSVWVLPTIEKHLVEKEVCRSLLRLIGGPAVTWPLEQGGFWKSASTFSFHPEGHQPWIFTGRTDAEVEAPVLWPPDMKSWLIEKDFDAGKDWRQKEKRKWLDGITDSMYMNLSKLQEMVKGSLVCCSPWGHKESSTTEWLNNNSHRARHRSGTWTLVF